MVVRPLLRLICLQRRLVRPITKELPLEYAVEMNRLIQLQMEGSVG